MRKFKCFFVIRERKKPHGGVTLTFFFDFNALALQKCKKHLFIIGNICEIIKIDFFTSHDHNIRREIEHISEIIGSFGQIVNPFNLLIGKILPSHRKEFRVIDYTAFGKVNVPFAQQNTHQDTDTEYDVG